MLKTHSCPNCNGTINILDDDYHETRCIDEDNYAVTYLGKCDKCKSYFHFDKVYKYAGIICITEVKEK